MKNRSKSTLSFAAGSVSLSMFFSMPAYSQDPERNFLNSVLSELDEKHPDLVETLDSLSQETVNAACNGDRQTIEASTDLMLLVNLVSRIQDSAKTLCVIRELQSMIGVREELNPTEPTPAN